MSEKIMAASSPKASDGHERDLRGELGRTNHLEHGVLLSQCAVLRLVAPRLPEKPNGSALDGKPLTRAKEGRSRLAIRLCARCGGHAVLLCHATLPTKKGPSRSRCSDVCFVLRIR